MIGTIKGWLSDREAVTFAIAVTGFLISLYNFLSGWFHSRVNLTVDFAHAFRFENDTRCVDAVHLKLYNRSSRELILSGISVNGAAFGSYSRQLIRRERTSYTNGVSRDSRAETWMSDRLPLRIPGRDFVDIVLVADFDGGHILLEKKSTLLLSTPSRTLKRKVTISGFAEKRLLEECRAPSSQS